MTTPTELFLTDSREQFQKYKELAEKAVAQVNDRQFFFTPGEESNSMALLMKHMAGNQLSRWTDFLTTDGEKPSRARDSEFVQEEKDSRQSILKRWEAGWECLFQALDGLKAEDLTKTVNIRQKPFSVIKAINTALAHYALHIGQILFLAKHQSGANWKSLSIPKKK